MSGNEDEIKFGFSIDFEDTFSEKAKRAFAKVSVSANDALEVMEHLRTQVGGLAKTFGKLQLAGDPTAGIKPGKPVDDKFVERQSIAFADLGRMVARASAEFQELNSWAGKVGDNMGEALTPNRRALELRNHLERMAGDLENINSKLVVEKAEYKKLADTGDHTFKLSLIPDIKRVSEALEENEIRLRKVRQAMRSLVQPAGRAKASITRQINRLGIDVPAPETARERFLRLGAPHGPAAAVQTASRKEELEAVMRARRIQARARDRPDVGAGQRRKVFATALAEEYQKKLLKIKQRLDDVRKASNNAYQKTIGPLRKVNRAVEKLGKALNNAGRNARNMGRNMQFTARDILFTVGALSSFAIIGVRSYMEVEEAAKQYTLAQGVLTDSTVDFNAALDANVEEIRQLAIDYNKFGVRAVEVGESLTTLSRIGLNSADSLVVFEDALKLAKITGGDLTDAVDVLTDVIFSFGESTEYSEQASKTLAFAVQNTKLRLGELKTTLQLSSGTATRFGISLAEMTAALDAVTKAGVPPSIASRRMATTIDTLYSKGRQYVRGLVDQEGKFVDLGTALTLLDDRYQSYSREVDRAGFLSEIFGTQQGELIAKLLNNRQAFDDYIKKLDETTITLDQLADAQKDAFGEQLKAVSATLNEFSIGMGDVVRQELMAANALVNLNDALRAARPLIELVARGFGQALGVALRVVNDAFQSVMLATDNLNDSWSLTLTLGEQIANKIAGFLRGIDAGVFTPVLEKLATSIIKIGKIFDAWLGPVTADRLTNVAKTIGLIAIAALAAVPALAATGVAIEAIGTAMSLLSPVVTVIGAAPKVVEKVADTMAWSAGQIVASMGLMAGAAGALTVAIGKTGVTGKIGTVVEKIVLWRATNTGLISSIGRVITTLGKLALKAGVVAVLITGVVAAVDGLVTGFSAGTQEIDHDLTGLDKVIRDVMGGLGFLFDNLAKFLDDSFKIIYNGVKVTAAVLGGFGAALWNMVGDWTRSAGRLWDSLAPRGVKEGLDKVGNLFSGLFTAIDNGLEYVGEQWRGLVDDLETGAMRASEIGKMAAEGMTSLLKGVAEWIGELADGLQGLIDKAQEFLGMRGGGEVTKGVVYDMVQQMLADQAARGDSDVLREQGYQGVGGSGYVPAEEEEPPEEEEETIAHQGRALTRQMAIPSLGTVPFTGKPGETVISGADQKQFLRTIKEGGGGNVPTIENLTVNISAEDPHAAETVIDEILRRYRRLKIS